MNLFSRSIAFVVLALALSATVAGALMAERFERAAIEARFRHETERVEAGIRQRFAAYEQVLRGGVALFAANGEVDRETWRRYVETLRLDEGYAGIQGVGFARRIEHGDLAAHEAAMRAQAGRQANAADAEAFEHYSVRTPSGSSHDLEALPFRTSIVYLEPFDARNRAAFGLDMFSEATRREAMQRAYRTTRAALSGRVTLAQEIDDDVQAGFLVYLPVYRPHAPLETEDERERALVGFVYSPFRARDLMTAIFGDGVDPPAFEVYDGDAASRASLLYAEAGTGPLHFEPGHGATRFARETPVTIAGRPWTVHYEPANAGKVGFAPTLVASIGTIFSLLLFGIVYAMASTRQRALGLAESMTHDLQQSEAKQRSLAQQLVRSNGDLEQFAYIASHDLQEPLRMITSYMQMLEQRYWDVLDDRGRRYIQRAAEGGERMHVLVNDLLEYSRVDVEKAPSEPTDAERSLDKAIDNLSVALTDSGAQILRGDLPQVSVDPPQLVRVLQNLIANSIKYRGEQPLRITVDAEPEGGDWIFSVADNGIGIDPAYFPRVFVMFARLHSRGAYPGNGMGLAICKKIVESHGGKIWVESTPGAGATFRFSFPGSAEGCA